MFLVFFGGGWIGGVDWGGGEGGDEGGVEGWWGGCLFF